jgi:hypothetical protein
MIRALLLLASVLAFVAAPFVTPNFAGYDPALFPVRIERPFVQPAGWAFAIWSVIYLWLLAHAGLGVWKRAEDPVWDRVRMPLFLACGIGATWLWLATFAPATATVAIWVMAVMAIAAHLRADPWQDRWLLAAPTAILAGWLTAAAAVSTGVLLAGYGTLSNSASALAMLAVALAIGVAVQSRSRMPVYGLTLVWALSGILAANGTEVPSVSVAAGAGMALMALAAGFALRSPRAA